MIKKYTLGGKYAWLCWSISVLFTIWIHVTQACYAIFNVYIQKDINLSIEQVGIIAAVYPCTAAIIQLFSGSFMDKMGPRKTIIPAIFVSVFGVFLISISSNIYQLIIAQLLLALGTSFGFVGSGYITSKWFTTVQFGLIFSLISVLVSFSVSFGQLGFSRLLLYFTWRQTLYLFVRIGIVLSVFAFFYIRLPDTLPQSKETILNNSLNIIRESIFVLKNKNIQMCCIYGGISYSFIWALGVVWLPKIVQSHGISLNISNISASLIWLGVAIGSLISNKVKNMINSTKKTLIIYIIVQFISILFLVYLPLNEVCSIIFSIILGISSSSYIFAYMIAKESVSANHSGAAISIVNSSMFFLGGLLLVLIGFGVAILGESLISYRIIMSILIVPMLLEFTSVFFIKETNIV